MAALTPLLHTPKTTLTTTKQLNSTPLLLKLNYTNTLLLHSPLSISSLSHNWQALKVSSTVAEEGAVETAPENGKEKQEEIESGEVGTPTKLYFGNLPYHCDSAQLAGIIEQYGTPELVEVLYNRDTGRSRGFAFVTMSSVEDCNAVIDNLDGSEYGGRYLRVNFADNPRQKEPLFPETEHKLFIGNLSWSVTSESLYEAFQGHGSIVGARVLYDGDSGKPRGYGFVCYATRTEMENALASLNGMVGSYFVTQYYSMLQQRPEYVHQLYSDASTMLRRDGHIREAASTMLQIHTLVMSMRFTSIEIKTIDSLESWNGGVIVMVKGSSQIGDFSGRRNFSQTFFLAPQDKGFFVLSDIFHFAEDGKIQPFSASLMDQNNRSAKLNASSSMLEPVASYMTTGGMQAREYMPPSDIRENGGISKYLVSEERLQQVAESESVLEDHSRNHANGFLECSINGIQEFAPSSVEEPVEMPQKHTYASVLRAAKAQAAPSVAYPLPSNRNENPSSEWQHPPQQSKNPSNSSQVVNDSMPGDMEDEFSAIGEIKSVYVRHLLPSVSSSELENEFKKFGQLSSEGVAIRRLKDTDVCYAFVEFEDIASVQSAIKAGAVEIAGRQVYIEERRANSSFARGRRGRGRASYQPDTSGGRFGGRGERDFSRSIGNGYYR